MEEKTALKSMNGLIPARTISSLNPDASNA
jgi:hypothetical protein